MQLEDKPENDVAGGGNVEAAILGDDPIRSRDDAPAFLAVGAVLRQVPLRRLEHVQLAV